MASRVLTTLITESFAPGLAALMRSILRNGRTGLPPLFAVYYLWPLELRTIKMLRSIWPRSIYEPISDCGELPGWAIDKAGPRWSPGLHKLLLFNAPFRDMVFIDADCLCVGDISLLLQAPDLSVAVDYEYLDKWPCVDALYSTGVMCMQHAPARIDAALDVYRRDDREYRYGDQDALNYAMREQRPDVVRWLSPAYNMYKRACVEHPGLVERYGVRMWHYGGIKPWEPHALDDTPPALLDLWRQYDAEV